MEGVRRVAGVHLRARFAADKPVHPLTGLKLLLYFTF